MFKHLWDKLVVGLDGDQRIVFPKMYLDNKNLYDKICGIAYLISTPDGLDWVWQNGVGRVRENDDYIILEKMLIVRLRLPWNQTRDEWLCDQDELNAHREEYEVLEVYIRAAPKNDPDSVKLLDPLEFEMNREEYTVLEAKYFVCWKQKSEEIERLLDKEV
jgi:hypothetical protein